MGTRYTPNLKASPAWTDEQHVRSWKRELRLLEQMGLGDEDHAEMLREWIDESQA